MESDKLIEAMAQAMAQTEYPAMSYEELATVALNALRDTAKMVPQLDEDGEVIGYLYALPEVKP